MKDRIGTGFCKDVMSEIHPKSTSNANGTVLTLPSGPKLLFFYGTLQLPHILKDVVGLDATPTLRNANIRGYTKMWGPYPALVKGTHEDSTTGKAWMLHEENHLKRLIYYETRNYRLEAVEVCLEGGNSSIAGYTFTLRMGVLIPRNLAHNGVTSGFAGYEVECSRWK
ncbi:hypothetical protein L218DRAFT_967257 [Marasmius fiardii PR-910]|nr:hypothetical protein L218DRAFT_967257 [Marasmius fiardii PR-910]